MMRSVNKKTTNAQTWVCLTSGESNVRGFNGVLNRNGVETVSIFDKDHLRKVLGKRVYLHCDIMEAIKDITEKCCVEWFKSLRNACCSLEPLSGPAYLCFRMKTYAVELNHLFLPGSRVAQQMGYRLSETAFQAMAQLSSNGRVRLKPSLRHTKNGQKNDWRLQIRFTVLQKNLGKLP